MGSEWWSTDKANDAQKQGYGLCPAKTYILTDTPQTYVIKPRAGTDNSTIEKGPGKGNRGPVRGTDGPVSGTQGPVTGTGPLFIAQNPFSLHPFLSGICKRGRQNKVSLICSANKSEQIGRKQSKSEQIGTNSRKQGAQIGTNIGRKRGNQDKSEQIGTSRGDPLLPTPNRRLQSSYGFNCWGFARISKKGSFHRWSWPDLRYGCWAVIAGLFLQALQGSGAVTSLNLTSSRRV